MTTPKPAAPLRYSIVAEMAHRSAQPAPQSKPFSLADAMRQKVEREGGAS